MIRYQVKKVAEMPALGVCKEILMAQHDCLEKAKKYLEWQEKQHKKNWQPFNGFIYDTQTKRRIE